MGHAGRNTRALIVEPDADLGQLWARHLEHLDIDVVLTATAPAAVTALEAGGFDVIVINLEQDNGSALAVADVASLRHPRANVVFVTSGRFFSDGSIFAFSGNARMMVQSTTPPDDLAQIVRHYGSGVSPADAVSQSPAKG
ncbi:hypothetical protein SAMN05428995_101853 [Loktanella sp. DSM 29012]|uniref:Response regulatory domain-containing protein n=1 Tax=Loktanella gaetbuli TaxID=2881335 RepID=A0ABS8BWN2_9RHOB|nr:MULTISPECIES: hypothetical protein [Loktanella]MCB5200157.1 hypothetical protein [Loktanella gaetbuli]SEP80382.1 hypothetical protein SAMN05428995_101853 [Loktanella sp. DSM 29012]